MVYSPNKKFKISENQCRKIVNDKIVDEKTNEVNSDVESVWNKFELVSYEKGKEWLLNYVRKFCNNMKLLRHTDEENTMTSYKREYDHVSKFSTAFQRRDRTNEKKENNEINNKNRKRQSKKRHYDEISNIRQIEPKKMNSFRPPFGYLSLLKSLWHINNFFDPEESESCDSIMMKKEEEDNFINDNFNNGTDENINLHMYAPNELNNSRKHKKVQGTLKSMITEKSGLFYFFNTIFFIDLKLYYYFVDIVNILNFMGPCKSVYNKEDENDSDEFIKNIAIYKQIALYVEHCYGVIYGNERKSMESSESFGLFDFLSCFVQSILYKQTESIQHEQLEAIKENLRKLREQKSTAEELFMTMNKCNQKISKETDTILNFFNEILEVAEDISPIEQSEQVSEQGNQELNKCVQEKIFESLEEEKSYDENKKETQWNNNNNNNNDDDDWEKESNHYEHEMHTDKEHEIKHLSLNEQKVTLSTDENLREPINNMNDSENTFGEEKVSSEIVKEETVEIKENNNDSSTNHNEKKENMVRCFFSKLLSITKNGTLDFLLQEKKISEHMNNEIEINKNTNKDEPIINNDINRNENENMNKDHRENSSVMVSGEGSSDNSYEDTNDKIETKIPESDIYATKENDMKIEMSNDEGGGTINNGMKEDSHYNKEINNVSVTSGSSNEELNDEKPEVNEIKKEENESNINSYNNSYLLNSNSVNSESHNNSSNLSCSSNYEEKVTDNNTNEKSEHSSEKTDSEGESIQSSESNNADRLNEEMDSNSDKEKEQKEKLDMLSFSHSREASISNDSMQTERNGVSEIEEEDQRFISYLKNCNGHYDKKVFKSYFRNLINYYGECNEEEHFKEKEFLLETMKKLCNIIKYKRFNDKRENYWTEKVSFHCYKIQRAYNIILETSFYVVTKIKELTKQLQEMDDTFIFLNSENQHYLNESNISFKGTQMENTDFYESLTDENMINDFFFRAKIQREGHNEHLLYALLNNYEILLVSLKEIFRKEEYMMQLKNVLYYIKLEFDRSDDVKNNVYDSSFVKQDSCIIPLYCNEFFKKFRIKEEHIKHIQSLYHHSVPTIECLNMFITCLNDKYSMIHQKKVLFKYELNNSYLSMLPFVYCCQTQVVDYSGFINLKETCQNIIKREQIYQKYVNLMLSYNYNESFFIIPLFTFYGKFLIILKTDQNVDSHSKESLNRNKYTNNKDKKKYMHNNNNNNFSKGLIYMCKNINSITYDLVINSCVFPNESCVHAISHFTNVFINSLNKCFEENSLEEHPIKINYKALDNVDKQQILYQEIESPKNRNEIIINMFFLIESFFNNTKKIRVPSEFNQGLRFLYIIRLSEYYYDQNFKGISSK